MSLMGTLSDVFSRAGVEHTVSTRADGLYFMDRDDNLVLACSLRVYPWDKTALIEKIRVGVSYKNTGHKIGGTTVRHIAAELFKDGFETLEIFRVREDGLTFWPAMGALPDGRERLSSVLGYVTAALPHDHADRAKTALACKRASDNAEETWFQMTDKKSDIYLSRETLRQINTAMSLDQTMVFEFDRPVVRQRLGLGSL